METKNRSCADGGLQKVDGALKGIGGCPMANDELVGNMDTSLMIPTCAAGSIENN
jgi:hydroxymethylglutaryl-CoA lyase